MFVLFKTISYISITLSATWLFLLSIFLLASGGRYSMVTEGGAMVCRIPIFTAETWLWTSFELFGIPTLIIIASWRTLTYRLN